MNEPFLLLALFSHNGYEFYSQHKPDLLYSKIGEEVVMMTIESGKCFKINDVGSDIWEMIKEPISVNPQIAIVFFIRCTRCNIDKLPPSRNKK